MAAPTTSSPLGEQTQHLVSPEEYHAMAEAGVFADDARIELIEGVLVGMTAKGSGHDDAVEWLNEELVLGLDRTRWRVRPQLGISFGASEPEPDLAICPRGGPQPYHPGSAVLIIEVAVTSLKYDTQTKRERYAAAEVDEYWVVDVLGRRVLTHAVPRDGDYTRTGEVGAGGTLRAAALPELVLRVDELFAAIHAAPAHRP